jgi:hypothetical protein
MNQVYAKRSSRDCIYGFIAIWLLVHADAESAYRTEQQWQSISGDEVFGIIHQPLFPCPEDIKHNRECDAYCRCRNEQCTIPHFIRKCGRVSFDISRYQVKKGKKAQFRIAGRIYIYRRQHTPKQYQRAKQAFVLILAYAISDDIHEWAKDA